MLTVDLKSFNLKAQDRVLDLGCGEGRHVNTLFFKEKIHAIGLDVCINDLQTAKQRFESLQEDNHSLPQGLSMVHMAADGLSLPFNDHCFDKIICSEVLEHIPDYLVFLKEMVRVLKPGGRLCLSVPRYWPEKLCWLLSDEYHANEGGHIRIFKSAQLKSIVRQYGLDFEFRHWAHALHSPFWWLKCLLWRTQDSNFLIKQYHKLLVWDLLSKPKVTHIIEQVLNPFMGKSVVLYFKKPI